MRVRRDVNSIPHRSATDTWKKIVGLITSDKSVDRGQLDKAEGVVTSLITDEFPAQNRSSSRALDRSFGFTAALGCLPLRMAPRRPRCRGVRPQVTGPCACRVMPRIFHGCANLSARHRHGLRLSICRRPTTKKRTPKRVKPQFRLIGISEGAAWLPRRTPRSIPKHTALRS